jgi:hypothetical protein
MTTVRWPLIFTIVRGYRVLHDVGLLEKPIPSDDYAQQLWTIMLNVGRRGQAQKRK